MSAPRSEWVECIQRPRPGQPRKAWCGRVLGDAFAFESLDHAAENGHVEGRLLACRACVAIGIAALKRGTASE